MIISESQLKSLIREFILNERNVFSSDRQYLETITWKDKTYRALGFLGRPPAPAVALIDKDDLSPEDVSMSGTFKLLPYEHTGITNTDDYGRMLDLSVYKGGKVVPVSVEPDNANVTLNYSTVNYEETYGSDTGHVWICNFPNSRPLSAYAKKALLSKVGEENADRALEVLNLLFPQGHGGVILMKSSGSTVYYDFGRYNQRCADGSEIELNFIDNIISRRLDPSSKAFSVPGEVRKILITPERRKSSIEHEAQVGGTSPQVYYAGPASDNRIDAAIDFANDLYSKECVQYSLIPKTALGKAYNCGSFAITVAAIAKTGLSEGSASRLVQYTNPAEPGRSIPPAALQLRQLRRV